MNDQTVNTNHLHATMPNASEALLAVRVKVNEIAEAWDERDSQSAVTEALWQVQKAITQVQLEIIDRVNSAAIADAAGETS